MSERKVLNKYYPPDYDCRKIPRLKRERSAQWVQRVMAPFNMRCNTCGHYIYRGTKFNARRETAQGETYLGLRIFRFYIRCPVCCADIAFKTDIENLDYAIESGATRNFEAAKLIASEDKKRQEEIAAEEANNPMAVLENRTKDSRREIEIMENLEELKERADSNAQTSLNDLIGDSMNKQRQLLAQLLVQQEDEDEAFINSLYEKTSDGTKIKRISTVDGVSGHSTAEDPDVDLNDCDSLPNLLTQLPSTSQSDATSLLCSKSDSKPSPAKAIKLDSTNKSKKSLSDLVKPKAKKSNSSSITTKSNANAVNNPNVKVEKIVNNTELVSAMNKIDSDVSTLLANQSQNDSLSLPVDNNLDKYVVAGSSNHDTLCQPCDQPSNKTVNGEDVSGSSCAGMSEQWAGSDSSVSKVGIKVCDDKTVSEVVVVNDGIVCSTSNAVLSLSTAYSSSDSE